MGRARACLNPRMSPSGCSGNPRTWGVAPAQGLLGLRYEDGEGLPQSDSEAARWYKLSSDQGFALSSYRLGMLVWKGRGVPQSAAEAIRLVRLGAQAGHPNAQYELAMMLGQTSGAASPAEPVTWFRLAAEQGHVHSQISLGVCYQEGIGVQPDRNEARRWFKTAADRGDRKALEYLQKLDAPEKPPQETALPSYGFQVRHETDGISLILPPREQPVTARDKMSIGCAPPCIAAFVGIYGLFSSGFKDSVGWNYTIVGYILSLGVFIAMFKMKRDKQKQEFGPTAHPGREGFGVHQRRDLRQVTYD